MSVKSEETMREDIIKRIDEVPSVPAFTAQIIALIQDPDADMTSLAEAVEYDPGLTTNVLRWANSAYFGAGFEITTVRDAVVRLGMKQLFQMVICSVAAPVVSTDVKGYGLASGALLEQSVAAAIGAEQLGAALKIPVPPYAFTAGLLHDIGKVVMGPFLETASSTFLELVKSREVALDEAERQILGIDHAEVGGRLLDQWGIPHEITEVVRWHHQPQLFEGESIVLDLVHVAEVFSMEFEVGAGFGGLNYVPNAEVVARLRLRPEIIEEARSRTLSSLEDVRRLFAEN